MFLVQDDWINFVSLALHQASQDLSFDLPHFNSLCSVFLWPNLSRKHLVTFLFEVFAYKGGAIITAMTSIIKTQR